MTKECKSYLTYFVLCTALVCTMVNIVVDLFFVCLTTTTPPDPHQSPMTFPPTPMISHFPSNTPIVNNKCFYV